MNTVSYLDRAAFSLYFHPYALSAHTISFALEREADQNGLYYRHIGAMHESKEA